MRNKHSFKIEKLFAAVLAISLPYLIIRSFFIFPIFSDENIYINMAKAVNEGLLPYKDFFFAHPPFQLLLFQPILLLFGANFIAIKILVLILSIGATILTYLITKELFGDFAGFLSFLFFLVFPGFLIFASQATGVFEALFFFLLGFYFLIKRRLVLSVAFLSIAIFIRYLVVLLLPGLIYYSYQYNRKILNKFLKFLILTSLLIGFAITIVFGREFLIDTLFYHTQTNLSFKTGLAQWIDQYLTLGFFTVFLSLTALVFSIIRKGCNIMIFAIYPLIYDFLILLFFNTVIYHYFILALPFLFVSVGATFAKANYFIVRASILTILLFSIVTNIQSITLYLDKSHSEIFPMLVSYVRDNFGENDLIFGEPRTTNYVSFVTNVKIVNNYFDSDLKFINFAGRERIFNEITKAKPKVIIIDNNFNYISELGNKYNFVTKMEVQNYYTLSIYKLT